MKKRLIAMALIFVMVSAFAVTSIVSAQPDTSAIQQFDIKAEDASGNIVVFGKLTIDTISGHYAVNWNPARLGNLYPYKSITKDNTQQTQFKIGFGVVNTKTREEVRLSWLALTNNGGNIHGEGTLNPSVVSSAALQLIAGWNPDDVMVRWASAPNT